MICTSVAERPELPFPRDPALCFHLILTQRTLRLQKFSLPLTLKAIRTLPVRTASQITKRRSAAQPERMPRCQTEMCIRDSLMSFLYGDCQDKFRCVFVFDPYERSINVYDADRCV